MKKLALFFQSLLVTILVTILYLVWPNLMEKGLMIGKDWLFNHGIIVPSIILEIVFFLGMFAFLLLLVAFYYPFLKESWNRYQKGLKKNTLISLCYGLTCFVLILGVHLLSYQMGFSMDSQNEQVLMSHFLISPSALIFLTIFYYPIVEELVFKKTIRDMIKNRYAFILISSFFFWYFHLAMTGFSLANLISSLSYFVGSLIYSYAFVKHNQIFMGISSRMIYNAIVTLLTLL